jgi:hypothetical protein
MIWVTEFLLFDQPVDAYVAVLCVGPRAKHLRMNYQVDHTLFGSDYSEKSARRYLVLRVSGLDCG